MRTRTPNLREQASVAGAANDPLHVHIRASSDVYARNELITTTAHALHATGKVEGIHAFAVARALHAAGLLAEPHNTP